MFCETRTSSLDDEGVAGFLECMQDGKSAGNYLMSFGNVQIDIPPTMLAADVARLEIRWSEASEGSAR